MSLGVHSLAALKDNYIYVLADERKKEAVVIDPGEAEPVLAFLARHNLTLTEIFCTHHHRDHIGGARPLHQLTGAPITCSAFDLPRIEGATRGLAGGQAVTVLGEALRVIAVPGHTDGQIALWFNELGILFVGDTLFSGGCGRLFEGSFQQMFESLAKLKALPANTKIYFGHEYTLANLQFILQQSTDPVLNQSVLAYRSECEQRLADTGRTTPTTVARELEINPFFRAATPAEFAQWREARNAWHRPD